MTTDTYTPRRIWGPRRRRWATRYAAGWAVYDEVHGYLAGGLAEDVARQLVGASASPIERAKAAVAALDRLGLVPPADRDGARRQLAAELSAALAAVASTYEPRGETS